MKLTRRNLFGALAATAGAATAKPHSAETVPFVSFTYEDRARPTDTGGLGLGIGTRFTTIFLAYIKDVQKCWISSHKMARLTKSCMFGDTNPARCVVVICQGPSTHHLYGRQAEDFLRIVERPWLCPRCQSPASRHRGLWAEYHCGTRAIIKGPPPSLQTVQSIGPECLRRTHGEGA